jgi:hypothetical protein
MRGTSRAASPAAGRAWLTAAQLQDRTLLARAPSPGGQDDRGPVLRLLRPGPPAPAGTSRRGGVRARGGTAPGPPHQQLKPSYEDRSSHSAL